MGSGALLGKAGPGKDPGQAPIQEVAVHGGRHLGGPGVQVRDDLHLLMVVALEVDGPVLDHEGALLGQGTDGDGIGPRGGVRPGQEFEVAVGVLEGWRGGVRRDGPKVDGHRTVSDGAGCESGRERDVLVGFAREPGERGGDVDIGGREHSGLIEGGQETGGASCRRPVAVVVRHRGGHEVAVRSPSSRSETASTSATGGRQEKTPQG